MSELLHDVDASSEPGTLESLETHLSTHYCSQCPNHSAMNHPPKTDWHQLRGITHWQQQRVDSGQDRFYTDRLTPGTGI